MELLLVVAIMVLIWIGSLVPHLGGIGALWFLVICLAYSDFEKDFEKELDQIGEAAE
jgi:hypothetical protein